MANNIYIQMNAINVNTNTQYSIAIVRNTNPIINFTIDNRYLKTAQIFVGVMGTATNVDSEFSIYIGESSTYEPYGYKVPVVCGGITTNIYLDEPIGENESISLSDTNTNIPTIRGTNILSVDTTVQPSNVYVKARKESQYETAMREEYEQELSNIESALEEV